jgi:hypothetical protein
MTLKVWEIYHHDDNGSVEGYSSVEGPNTDHYHVEVVEKAEYDKLRGALEEINDLIPSSAFDYYGHAKDLTWVVEDSKEIIRKVLDASTPSS